MLSATPRVRLTASALGRAPSTGRASGALVDRADASPVITGSSSGDSPRILRSRDEWNSMAVLLLQYPAGHFWQAWALYQTLSFNIRISKADKEEGPRFECGNARHSRVSDGASGEMAPTWLLHVPAGQWMQLSLLLRPRSSLHVPAAPRL